MHTVAVIAQKGGPGKSMIAIHVAAAAVQVGAQAGLIDLDPQATTYTWSLKRLESHPDLPSIEVIQGAANPIALTADLKMAREQGADLVLIDTSASSDEIALLAASQADFILIPTTPDVFDLEAISPTLDLIQRFRKAGVVVFNKTAPIDHDFERAQTALTEIGAHIAPVRLGLRKAYPRAVEDGRTVFDLKGKDKSAKATEEITALYDWLYEQLTAPAKAGEGVAS